MMRTLILLAFLLIFTGCLSPIQDLYPPNEEDRPVPVYVVSHGWHAGIAIESKYIQHLLPDHPKMPEGRILKFGWGDLRYYSEPDAGFGLMLRAALLPTRSVLHVVATDLPIERYFYTSRVIRIQISHAGAEQLGIFISDRFRRDEDGNIKFVADGLYSNSQFFEASGHYYLPKTSNTWTARALRQTGYPITPIYGLTSGNVIKQALKEGYSIQ
tara:strand:- start:12350 stop:12991 length:642 start_codon:yes stop_codon:yes gene_type:complete